MPGLACAAPRRAAPRRIARADRSRRRKPGASPPASGDLPGAARPRMVGDERAVLGDVRRDPRTPGGVVALVMRVCRPPRPQQQQQHERPSMCHPRSPAPGPPLCRPRLPACVALLRATFPASWLPQHFCHTATPPALPELLETHAAARLQRFKQCSGGSTCGDLHMQLHHHQPPSCCSISPNFTQC